MYYNLYGNSIQISIYDNAGQERFRHINESNLRSADACILVYDITNRKSFEECNNDFKNRIKENCKKNIKVMVIGNKIDLEEYRIVSMEEGKDFALRNGYLFYEISCKNNDNVFEAFEYLISETKKEKEKELENYEDFKNITLNKKNNLKKKKCC